VWFGRAFLQAVLAVWEAPQTVLGLGAAMAVMVRARASGGAALSLCRAGGPLGLRRTALVVEGPLPWGRGVSLGRIIVVERGAAPQLLAHEFGHYAVQCLLLGPAYLPTVLATYAVAAIVLGSLRRGLRENWIECWADRAARRAVGRRTWRPAPGRRARAET